MVVITAAVCSKSGKVLVSRQFQEITRLRIEGLLAAFPKLLSSSDKSQSYIETDSVRYLYQPLEQVYVLLVTNKASNIIDDLETLQTIYKVTTEQCHAHDEDDITRKAFDLIFAYDEIIACGYREKVNMQQIAQYLEMDSQEERLFEMIERNKRREAMEEAKRRQHMIEMERQEARMHGGYNDRGAGSSYSSGPQIVSYQQPQIESRRPASPPKPQKRGMVLAPKGKKNDFLEALDSEIQSKTVQQAPAAAVHAPVASAPAGSMAQKNVHFVVDEKVSLVQHNDADINLEVKGELSIVVNDPNAGRVFTVVNKPSAGFQYKTHPNIDKNRFSNEQVLILRRPERPLPTGTPLGLLKWRFVSQNEGDAPMTVTFWPTPNGDGTTTCSVECELQQQHMQMECIEVHIPIPSQAPPLVEHAEGAYQHIDGSNSLVWQIPSLNSGKLSASMEFKVKFEGENAAFYPIHVGFVSATIYSTLKVENVYHVDSKAEVPFSVEEQLEVENYEIVAV